MDIVEFLRARLSEDEELARAAAEDAGEPDWDVAETWIGGDEGGGWETVVGPAVIRTGGEPAAMLIMRCDPTAVLREVEAKRRILAQFVGIRARSGKPGFGDGLDRGAAAALEFAVRCHALPYSDHPDYRQEWKP